MHVARPVIEVFADTATSSRGCGARSGGNVGCEGKVVGGPSVWCLSSGATVSVPLFQILPVVVLGRVGADGLEDNNCVPSS